MAIPDIDWSLFRAYTSLSLAEAGTENVGIDGDLVNFDTGNVNLTTNNLQWNFACYANGTTGDGTAVTISGWGTSADNYLKFYTPTAINEVGISQRHSGVFTTSKYKHTTNSSTDALYITEVNYVEIDGLQIDNAGGRTISHNGISSSAGWIKIENSIINGNASAWNGTINLFSNWGIVINAYINNNIITTSGIDDYDIDIQSASITAYVYGNTLISNYCGLRNVGTALAKNNISYAITLAFSGTFAAGTGYNATNKATMNYTVTGGAVGDRTSQTFSFVDSANGDYHLLPSDAGAKNYGTDLSNDSIIQFNTDIDSNGIGTNGKSCGSAPSNVANNGSELCYTRPRGTTWDIGADEVITPIYRSVAPEADGDLGAIDDDNSQADTLSITTAGVATFEVAVADNVGVGDAIVFDDDADNDLDASDTILFIHGRTDSTHYTVRTDTGGFPTASTTDNDKWAIYRAYTSLSLAEAGTKNTAIPISFTGGNRDIAANSEQWNIACYANGTTADTTAVDVRGWTTAPQNYIRIYTSYLTTEVGTLQRHLGKWDENKYKLVTTNPGSNVSLRISDSNVRIDGIQIDLIKSSGSSSGKALYVSDSSNRVADVRISNNIIKGQITYNPDYVAGIHCEEATSTGTVRIWNNIVYDFNLNYGYGIFLRSNSSKIIYNNTIVNSVYYGIKYYDGSADITLKNNIVQGATDGYQGTFNSISDYNLSDIATDAPGTNSRNSTTVTFADATNKDFHLSSLDAGAKDYGADLSNDPIWQLMLDSSTRYRSLGMTGGDDIDGAGRPMAGSLAWDIGADEVSTAIYRSVGPSKTDYLDRGVDESGTDMSITGSTATIENATPDNVGVGDVIQYDSDNNGTVDALAFITARTSSSQYTVKSAIGGTPIPTTVADQDWGIYRAYSALYFAERGDENTGLTDTVENFDDWTVGGVKDADDVGKNLLTYNEQWNIAAYANGGAADTTQVSISDWTTGPLNYLKVYTPTATTEVGTSQRHQGKLDTSKYWLNVNHAGGGATIRISIDYVRIEGLQTSGYSTSGWGGAEIMFDIPSGVTDSDTRISNNIFKTDYTMVSDPYDGGLMSDNGWSNNGGVKKIYNNIMYGIKDSHFNLGIITYGGTWYVYNNTIVNPTTAINQGGGTMIAKNNIVQNASDGFNGYSAGSDYNISNIASDAPSASYRNGLATTVTFEDAANFDFHLSSVDVGARDVGADLSADPYLSVTQDIDGHTRNVSSHTGNFDIGADEGATAMYFSVGQNTTTHETGAGDVDVDATTKTATFTVAQTATNMGVGDVIDYDSDNKKCYITGKTSTSVWTCVSATGTAPTDSGGNVTVNSISHAFQYLHNAIDSGHNGVGDATHLNTLDLWTNNYQLNVPCYYDSAADATAVEINGWTTGAPNYLRIYTPNNIATEVNQSQRHSGKWDEGKYRIEFTGEYGGDTFYVRDNNVKVSGLEINIHGQTNGIFRGILFYPNSDVLGDSIEINDNIIKGDWTGSAYGVGITGYTNLNNKSTTFKAWNNIIYDMSNGSNGSGIYIDDGYDVMARAYVYNNTIYNSYIGIHRTSGYAYLKNNIVQNCTDGYSGTMDASSDYNISNVASDAPSASYRSGQATTVTFQDSTNKDFHLGLTDTMARNVGANLSSDSSFAFATDIDGNGRGTWDIGADEGSVEAVASVMEGGGDYSSLSSWETGMQTDLTSTATMVYAGTLTSTIADNASLYLCRGGVYQNVTSNTVHVTSTQLLAEIISTPTSVASGDVWYTNNTCNSANYFTTTDAGNPAIAVAKIDGAWSSADTNVVSFDGWVTGLTNYAKIYTTTAARHQGKWDDTKYNLNNQIVLWETYVYIDGMQINTSGTDYGIFMYGPPYVPAGEVNVVNSIIKSRNSVFGGYGSGTGQITKFSNNIMHSSERPYIAIGGIGEYFYLYNNTIITNGMFGYTSGATHEIVKNNIIQGATSYGYYGSFDASSTNNLSNLADAPGSNPQNSKSVIFADAGGEDYHLSQNDTSAKNMGADLSADTYLPIDDDIDGQTRNATTSNFDIGADETAIQVFYSVGQNTSNHMTGTPTVTIASGVGTFSAAQTATNMGVGDKITYNTNVVAYISEKISDVKWKLITATGGTPADITGSTVVSIAHAYASLSLAEAGIPTPLGTSDLVTGNYQVNIPCYYDTGADVTPVDVSGWTTGANNYIKIYTPNSTVSEVNQSQRHSGKWDDEKYSLNTGRTNWNIWSWNGVDIWIDGLQFKGYGGVVFYHIVSASVAKVSNCILDGDNETVSGIEAYYLYAGSTFYAWNNIIYGFASGGWYGGITASPTTSVSYIYNNTVIVGSGYNNFAYAGNSSTHFKNNIGQGGLIGYSFYGAPFNADSSNNLTDDTSAPGSNSRISITPTFADTATSDYRLSLADTGAKDYGTDLSSEGSTFGMTGIEKDISGNYRTSTWDIGASEAGQTVFQSEALEKNSIADGLVLYQSFNGEDINGTTAIDRSGNGNDGTISGATAAMGKRGQALDFDGSSGYVTAGTLGDAAMTENGPMAISAWIYPRSDGQASQGFIVARDGNAGPYFQMYPSNKLIFAVPGGTQLYRLSLDNSISYNAWQHVVVTWDGSTNASNVHLYVNGFQSDGATNNGTSLTDNSASNLYIGNNPYYNRTFDGSLDEVRVYNRVLSTDEIGSLYKLGEAKMNSPQATNANNGLVLSQSFDGRYMDWSQASAEARDASGQNNHGDVVGATATIGKRGQALSFNGNSDYVAVSGNPLGTGEATIGAWIKPTSVSSCRIYSSSAFPYSDFEIDGSNSRLFFTNDAGVTAAVSANSSITANSWQFVTAVRNSSNQVTIYINGSQSGTANQSAGTPTGGSTSNYIGTRFDHGSGFFPGKIDEVRIYNRALSSDEVKDLYKMGEVKVSK
jgi:parallel beta-helix repeat protein